MLLLYFFISLYKHVFTRKKNVFLLKILKEIPIKFTIVDLIETPDSAELVSCLLELDEYEKINFKFGLNTDLPQDIANRLVTT